MNETRGAFIVIEGTDGSGKSTQFELIRKRLEDTGYDVAVFKFPRYDNASSYFVRRYLNGDYGKADDVGPYSSSLFYALDRFEASGEIRQALEQGKVVLCDRFTGSNMAHQGTKIENPEQRRGFFIWLDNLEFEMLRIPRPDISFILRVSPDIAHRLMAEKQRDIHESDLSHLERAAAVYDDMAQLFPKDFQRIDCVRSGELLDIDTVNLMLWEKIHPLLPSAPIKTTADKAQTVKPTASTEEVPAKEEPQPTKQLVLENTSGLVAQKIERLVPGAEIEVPDIPSVFIPERLVPDAEKEYRSKTDTLLGLYAKLVAGLAKRGISTQEARRHASLALPVAASRKITVEADDPNLEELVLALLNDPLAEAQAAGANLFSQALRAKSKSFKNADEPVKRQVGSGIKALANEYLSENNIGEQPPVQLTAAWPRNELDLVPEMLYEHSNLPLNILRDRVASWPIDRKLSVFEKYMENQAGPVLERVHYSWDIQSSYSVFRELQTHASEALEIQPLTPRYGFAMPELIEEAGLSDTFEKCFDLSLALFSALQSAGHQADAQYATLSGHSQRWKMTQNATQAISLIKLVGTSPEAQKTLEQMRLEIIERHPAIGESIKSTP